MIKDGGKCANKNIGHSLLYTDTMRQVRFLIKKCPFHTRDTLKNFCGYHNYDTVQTSL